MSLQVWVCRKLRCSILGLWSTEGSDLSIPDSDRDDCTCSPGLVEPIPGLCSTPSVDRASDILPCPGSPVHVSSLSIVNSPKRSLRHEGGSPFQADSLGISSDPVDPGILALPGTNVPRGPLPPPLHDLTTYPSNYGWGCVVL